MRILIVDTYYPDAIAAMPFNPEGTYESNLQAVLARAFGTGDFYSRNLRALGHECIDVIANHEALQGLWARENGISENIVGEQVRRYRPDVVLLQDLSVFNGVRPRLQHDYILAAQCSCPIPSEEYIKKCDVIFSSMPHHVETFRRLGVRAIYNPLAFEPDATYPLLYQHLFQRRVHERIHDCVFIGGVGAPSHWKYGMEVLNAVAEAIPTFRWWGYGCELLPDGPLKQKYQGQAFGTAMYSVLLQSKIVLNRHGEVAEGHTNNMRTYEATGTGALLLTEESKNIWDLFSAGEVATYLTPAHAVEKVRYYLEKEDERREIALAGQRRTLLDHTYSIRIKKISEILTEMCLSDRKAQAV